MTKVSVIVPIYNKEKYLDRSIKSILNQSLVDLELILVNDGSTDNSLEICRKFELKDNRIKVIDQKNSGVSVARNSGLVVAEGEYIAFVDPDDWIENDMYLNMYNDCIETKSDVGMCNYFINRGKKVSLVTLITDRNILTKDRIFNEIVLNMLAPEDVNSGNTSIMGSVWRLLIRKDLIRKDSINFQPGIPLMEDLIFCIKIFVKASRVCIVKGHYYHYCIEEDSVSIVYRENMYELELKVIKIIEQLLKDENLYELSKQRLYNRYINSAISSIYNEFHRNNSSQLKYKIKNVKQICSSPEIQRAISSINYNNYTFRKRMALAAIKHNNALYLSIYYRLLNKRNNIIRN